MGEGGEAAWGGGGVFVSSAEGVDVWGGGDGGGGGGGGGVWVCWFRGGRGGGWGGGGMLTTADKELDQKFRLLRQHAMSAGGHERHRAGVVVFEEYPEVGFNYRMTDIQ